MVQTKLKLMLILMITFLHFIKNINSDGSFDFIINMASKISKEYERFNYKSENWKYLLKPLKLPTTKNSDNYYDFIIVGGGTGGSVVASRLSEISNWKILLLEAGEVENLYSRVPVLAQTLLLTPYAYNYLYEYQPNFGKGFRQGLLPIFKGRALGGTSVVNDMIYTRGNPSDFDEWVAQGNPGWSYDEVLPYFLKFENQTSKYSDYRYHNTDGYLHIEDTYHTPLVHAFIKAGGQMGYREYVDHNSLDYFGFSPIQQNTLQGTKHSTARAFLFPVVDRKNLSILTSAFVTKILIDTNNKRAYGVQYVKDGRTYKAYATKEVILSAGSLHAPQILMLSGVGPKQHLQELGIKVLSDLPVGQKLYDHMTYIGLTFKLNETVSLLPRDIINPKNIKKYIKQGKGPLSGNFAEALALIKTESSNNLPSSIIELELITFSLNVDYFNIVQKILRLKKEIYNTLWRPTEGIPIFSIVPILLYPKSFGYIKLRSTDPFTSPLFYGNYLSDVHEQDINTMITAVRLVQRLSKTDAFQRYATRFIDTPVPGCEYIEFDSDEYWKCALRTLSFPTFHHYGSNKMGPQHDPESVVDNELKVYGIRNLRVVDCSIIPGVIGAHPLAAVIMIAEKASDMIKMEWK